MPTPIYYMQCRHTVTPLVVIFACMLMAPFEFVRTAWTGNTKPGESTWRRMRLVSILYAIGVFLLHIFNSVP